jgi:hypothetical protein
MFAAARRDVLICGFTFDHGEEIFRPLYDAMVEHGVETTIFLDVAGSWKKWWGLVSAGLVRRPGG